MTVNEFLSRLEGVTPDGKGGYMACCPAHDDHNPSMHVNEGADGRILVKCYAGCSTAEIVAAMGLKLKDLMPARPEAPGRAGGKAKGKAKAKGAKAARGGKSASSVDNGATDPVSGTGKSKKSETGPILAGPVDAAATAKKKRPSKHICYYDYKREDGAIEFRVDRRVYTDAKGGKTFVQMSPDPSSPTGWAFGVASRGVEYIPYQLPLIRKAASAGRPVVILEGEKDVCTMIKRLKLAATCNAKGAGKWSVGLGRYFEGVPSILIIADKDAMTKKDRKTGEEKLFAVGQRHACDVERKLRADGYTGKIRKVAMPDVTDADGKVWHVKDFTDWVEAMEAAKRTVDKSSFSAAIEEFGAWPDEWQFNDDDLSDLQRVIKKTRNSASDMPGEASKEGESGKDDADDVPGPDGKGCGRFGRLSVHSPIKDARAYKVDYRIGSRCTARFEIGVDYYRFQGYKKSDGDDRYHGETVEKGKYFLQSDNEPLKLSLSSMYAMAFGNVSRFGSTDRDFKFGAKQVSELQASITLLWLRSRGKFFWDENAKGFSTSLFFDERTGVLMRVRSDEFMAFVATESEINRESPAFKYLMSLVDDAAMSDQVAQGVTPSNMWDRRGDAVYISSGDAEMYKISGGQVVKVQNGTDGVVFMRGKTLAPWTVDAGCGVDPFDKALIFKNASWSDKNGRMNVRLWTLNLFACHQTKPLLLITGAMQSGKTRMAKAIKEILGVRQDGRLDLSVQQVEDGDKGLDAFWATVNDGKLEVFDNLDTKIKWVSDTLQNVATDGQTKRRTLYTTFGVSILRANAHIILTSNNPLFSTEGNGGMADRLISVHLDTNRSVAMDTELSEDIARNRNLYMTWIARTIAVALTDRGDVDQSINRRHPDYGRFSVRCGRAFGDENAVVEALGAAEADKSLLPLMNDVITKEILRVLADHEPPYSMRFTAGDMSAAILARMGDEETDDKSKMIYGSRRIGRAMSRYLRQFSVIFKMMEPRILDGKTVYEFTGLTASGKLAMVSEVGKVGFDGTFQQSTRIQTGAGGFSENGVDNPLMPLHARARSCASSFDLKDKESNINTETESEDPDGIVF